MKKSIKNIIIFVSICSIMTLLLAITNYITAPIIEKNQSALANKSLSEVMPSGKGFEAMDFSSFTLPETVKEVYKETDGNGYVFKLVTSGYGSDMVIMCGVSKDGMVTGAVCTASNETLGKEKTYGENFKDKNAEAVQSVETISGATKTTEGYKNAVKDALNAAVILDGGSVDIRSEQEILNDNLKQALAGTNAEFEKLFKTEVLEGIDSVYIAKDGSGYVLVAGEQFVGVDSNGNVVTQGVQNPEIYTDAVTKIKESTLTDIDITAYPDLEKKIVKAQKTKSGNYVIEAKGPGYGIKGGDEYHPASNEYIIVRVCIGADGRIIDCLTVSQAETKGLGDECANESFYSQFVGKYEENYIEIDAISGATLTTNGYIQGVGRAFEAVSILKGGDK